MTITGGNILGFRQHNEFQELGVATSFPGSVGGRFGLLRRILGIPVQFRLWCFTWRKLLCFDWKEEIREKR